MATFVPLDHQYFKEQKYSTTVNSLMECDYTLTKEPVRLEELRKATQKYQPGYCLLAKTQTRNLSNIKECSLLTMSSSIRRFAQHGEQM
jgi:hypothetical protein